MKDLINKVHPRRAISPVSVTDNAALVGQIIDRQGFNSLAYLIAIGSVSDADATFTVLIEHGDDAALADAAAAPDIDLIGTEALAGFTFSDDDETRKIGYKGNKRYSRITITPANNASAALISAIALMGNPEQLPTPNPPA